MASLLTGVCLLGMLYFGAISFFHTGPVLTRLIEELSKEEKRSVMAAFLSPMLFVVCGIGVALLGAP